jgi:hypothetical protein
MRSRPFVLLLFVLAATPSVAQMLPRGVDDVLLVRLYRKTSVGMDPVGRAGFVLTAQSQSNTISMPATGKDPALTFAASIQRKGQGARGTWTLLASGSAAPIATGKIDVEPGSLDRAVIKTDAASEISASFEAGRASSFDVGKLSSYFGGAWGGASMPGVQGGAVGALPMGVGPGGTVVMGAPAPPPRNKGPLMDAQCPNGGTFEIALDSGHGRCALDREGGNIVGATCRDDDGNSASVNCTYNGGHGACDATSGSGTCQQK